jgi:FKBP-type peptidyl-prolyl cis-trans isomerase FkpA
MPIRSKFLFAVALPAIFTLSGCVATQAPSAPAAPVAAATAPSATATTPLVPSVPTTLQIIDRKMGDGPTVETNNPVAVHYSGYLWSATAPDNKGKKFDSSVEKPVPFGFIVGAGRVIKGWDEGLVGMKVGGQRTLIIPADKGYGARGSGDAIPPNSALVFDVELMSIIGKTQNANPVASPYVPAPKK